MPNLRRNGKRQACEPCRKSKLRCDHSTSTCGRRESRKVTSGCRYEVRLTKVLAPRTESSIVMSNCRSDPKGKLPLNLAYPDIYDFFAAGSSYVDKCPNGFLGPTAYSAILFEHQSMLDMDILDPCNSYSKDPGDGRNDLATHDINIPHSIGIHAPSRGAIRMGMFVLNHLPTRAIFARLVEQYAVF